MPFTWKIVVAALLAGGLVACVGTVTAQEDAPGDSTPAAVVTPQEAAQEAPPSAFEKKLEEIVDVARFGGEEELPIPERFEKALEMFDQAWKMERTLAESRQAISLKISMLMALQQEGMDYQGQTVSSYLEELSKSEDERIGLLAENTLLSLRMQQLGALSAWERRATIDEVKGKILDKEPSERTAVMAMTLANALSLNLKTEEAAKEISDLAKHFQSAEAPAIEQTAKSLIGLSNFLNLPGKPIELTGTRLNGEPLDFAKEFKGKAVLVDFWATWCGPCLAEFPRMKQLYDIYHPHGFEIVGISLDDEKEIVQQFVEANEIPWPIVFNPRKEDQTGWDDPNARRYGIMALPTMIFVGADGNVKSIEVRGPMLEQLLAEAYPDVSIHRAQSQENASQTPGQ